MVRRWIIIGKRENMGLVSGDAITEKLNECARDELY
jgi:hypothetical protein